MNFQSLPLVHESQHYIDKAFSKAKKRVDQLGKRKSADKVSHAKRIAMEKLQVVSKTIGKDFQRIIDEYPNFSNLPDFYEELVRSQLPIDKLRLALGRVNGCIGGVELLAINAKNDIRKATEVNQIHQIVKNVYGRVSSFIKRTNAALLLIEKARKILVVFPAIKEDLFTIALAGFPNVGKSTLLSVITPSKPKIASYAFTTKTLNIGYYKQGYKKIQVVDTPGTLARFGKMNTIEKQAYLCLKYVANLIVMVIDPTDTYSLELQEKLLAEIKDHDKDIIIFISKLDIANPDIVDKIVKKHKAICSTKELLKKINEFI